MSEPFNPVAELAERPDLLDMFDDFDGWIDQEEASGNKQISEMRENVKWSIDPEERKRRLSNQSWAIDNLGLSIQDAAYNWRALRPQIASQVFGIDGEVNESQLHGAIRNRLHKEKKEADFSVELASSAIQNAFLSEHGAAGGFAQSIQKLKSHEGYDDKNRGRYYAAFKETYDNYREKTPNFHKVFEQAVQEPEEGEEKGKLKFDPKSDEFMEFSNELARLDKEDQAYALSSILKQQGESGRDFLNMVGESFRRGGIDLLENGYLREAQVNIDASIAALKKGETIYVNTQESPTSPNRYTADRPTLFNATPLDPTKLDSKAAKRILGELEKSKREIQTRKNLRQFITGQLDPLEVAGDSVVNKLKRGAIGAARSAAYTGAIMGSTFVNPYAGLWVASGLYADNSFDDIMSRNPDADAVEANKIAGLDGAWGGATEMLQAMFFTGKFSSVRDFFRKRSLPSKFAYGMAAGQAGEMAQEYVQDTGSALIEEMASIVVKDPDLKDFDLKDHLGEIYSGEYFSELFYTTLPFSIVGGMGGASMNYFSVDDLSNMMSKDTLLSEQVLPLNEIEEIDKLGTVEEKLEKFRSFFNEDGMYLTRAERSLNEKKQALQQSQANPDTPTLSQTSDGKYTVHLPDGTSFDVDSIAEAVPYLDFTPVLVGDKKVEATTDKETTVETFQEGQTTQPVEAGSEVAIEVEPSRKPTETASTEDTFSVTEKIGITEPYQKPVFDSVRKNFRSRGDLPADAFEARVDSEAINNSIKKEVEFNVKRLEGAIRREIGIAVTPKKTKAKRKLLRDANEVMAGAKPVDSLPEGMRQTVLSMRAQIDQLSKRLITEGVVQGDLEQITRENLGSYLNRSYRVFDDPSWAKKVPAQIRNTAAGFLRRQNPIREGESKLDYLDRINGLINKELYQKENSSLEILARGKIGSKNLTILKNRKNIPPEIRALMGEYEGVIQNYAKSVFKISTLLSNNKFLERVKSTGKGVYLFEEAKGDFYAKISSKNNPSMAPIDGMYTTPEIAEAFSRRFDQQAASNLGRLYFSLNGFAKYGKVVLSPITQVRNFNSNTFYSVALGNIPFKGAGVSMRVNMQDVLPDFLLEFDPKRAEFQEAHKKYTRLGLLNESVTAGDFAGLLKDAFAGEMDLAAFSENLIVRASKKSMDAATKLYQAGDGFWKVSNFEAEKTKLQKAFPNRTEASIEKEAAQIVRDLTPTYSLVPPAIQKLRRFPFLGPFVSFASEVVRNNIKIAQRITYELNTDGYKEIGAKRLAGFVFAHSVAWSIVAFGKWVTGTSDEEEDAIRNLAAPWDENANILFLGNDEDGHVRFVNLSYVDPFSMLKKPFVALGRDGDLETKAANALGEIIGPFLGEELLSKALLDLSRNKNSSSGGRIWNEQESFDSKVEKMAAHLAKAIEPGFIAAGKRTYMAYTGEEGTWGAAYHLKDEIIANTTGNRIVGISPETSLLHRSRSFASDTSDAVGIFTSVATRPGKVSPEDLLDAYNQMETSRERLFRSFNNSFRSAILLGLPEEQAIATARAGGVTKKVLNQKDYEPYKLTPFQLKKLSDKKERLDLIKSVVPQSLN